MGIAKHTIGSGVIETINKTIGETAPYNTLDAALAASPPSGTVIVIPPGLAEAARTITANRTVPAGVVLDIYSGSPVKIAAGVTLTILGTVIDYNHQIFDDVNTYNLLPRSFSVSAPEAGQPLTLSVTDHGFRENERIFLAINTTIDDGTTDGGLHSARVEVMVKNIVGNTFQVYPHRVDNVFKSNGASLTGTLLPQEGFGVKFLNSNQLFVRPQWWGMQPNIIADAAANRNALQHALFATRAEWYSSNDIAERIPVNLGSGTFYINGFIMLPVGTMMYGAGLGVSGFFERSTTIVAKATLDQARPFMTADSTASVRLRDFYISCDVTAYDYYTDGLHIGSSGSWKSVNTRLNMLRVGGFKIYQVYAGPTGMMTYMKDLWINPTKTSTGGVWVDADSRLTNSRVSGGTEDGDYSLDVASGITCAGGMLRGNIVETCQTGITNITSASGSDIQGNWVRQVNSALDLTSGYSKNTIVGNLLGAASTAIKTTNKALVRNIISNNKIASDLGYGFDVQGFIDCVVTGNDAQDCALGQINYTTLVHGFNNGSWKDNIGVDLDTTPQIITETANPYRAFAFGGDSFVTGNNAATNLQYLNGFSSTPRREISITLGDLNTKFYKFRARQTGQSPYVYCYTRSGGFSAGYYNTAVFNIWSSPAALGDAIYVGDAYAPIVGVKFTLSTPSIGNTIVAEYYDGFEWVAIPIVNSGGASGYEWTWQPPPLGRYRMAPGATGAVVDQSDQRFTLAYAGNYFPVGNMTYGSHKLRAGDYLIISGFVGVGKIRKLGAAPVAGGTGYVVGDTLTISTGGGDATATVLGIDTTGGINSVKDIVLANPGTLYAHGTKETTGGSGTGCTVNVIASGNNGKFKVTALGVDVGGLSYITVDDANLVDEVRPASVYFTQAGWPSGLTGAVNPAPNMTAMGLPWTVPNVAGYFIRFRIAGIGGVQAVSSAVPQYSYMGIQSDFGPTTDITKKETIWLKEQNGVHVEQRRSSAQGVGAVVLGKAVATESQDGFVNKTVLELTLTGANDLDMADGADKGAGVKVYDFPAGRIMLLGAIFDGHLVSNDCFNASPNDVYKFGVGSVDATSASDGDLTGTEQDIIPAQTVDSVGNTVLTNAVKAALASSAQFDGTTTALDVYVNAAVLDASTTKAMTLAITGFLTLYWINLGDY
ncbi:MAG: hypothetical protein WC593_15000 [Methanoregula sp.]